MATIHYVTPENCGRLSARLTRSPSLDGGECYVYKKRWFILGIYVLCSMADAAHWLQYTIITHIVEEYYDVSTVVIHLTALLYNVAFVIFVFPALKMVDKMSLKATLITGDVLMIVGAWLKLVSVDPRYFYMGFAGQLILGTAQVFIINVPSYLAGLWFPTKEVSTACAIGVLGTQIGVAGSFFLPPQLFAEPMTNESLKTGFFWLYTIFAIPPTLLLPVLVFFFKSTPPLPPAFYRPDATDDFQDEKLSTTWRRLLRNYNYDLMVLSYSLSVATYYCLSTLLGVLVVQHYPNGEKFAGWLGALMIAFSIFGCLASGWALDKTHKFTLIAASMYVASLISLVLFWVALKFDIYYLLILSTISIGFFMASYIIVAIEFSSELTYPIFETISTSFLLLSGEVASIFHIYMASVLLEYYGDLSVIYSTMAFMVLGTIVTFLVSDRHLKRYNASTQNVIRVRVAN